MTYTYAEMEVTSRAYDEIKRKLVKAGHGHALHQDGERILLDMRGIALVRAETPPGRRFATSVPPEE